MIVQRAALGSFIFALTAFCVSGESNAAPTVPRAVPCGVFGARAACVNPIQEGTVDGQWIGLIFHYDGTNGGPDEINVVSIGFGGNGLATKRLPSIKPAGKSGDRMSAAFRRGKLFVTNAIYGSGEAHCCFTHEAVRRFGFHNQRLVVEREVVVRSAASASQIDAALKNNGGL